MAVSACGGGETETLGSDSGESGATQSEAEAETTPPETTAAPTEAAETSEAEEETTPAEEAPQDLQAEAGFTSAENSIGTRHTSFGALITNPNESLAAYDVSVTINLLGDDGSILETDTERVEYLAPGATLPVATSVTFGFDLDSEPADYELSMTGEFREDEGYGGVSFSMNDGIELDVADASIGEGSLGAELSFTATNPGEDVVEFGSWNCVFLSSGEVVGGDGSTIIDPIAPGATIRVDSGLSVEIDADEVICHAIG